MPDPAIQAAPLVATATLSDVCPICHAHEFAYMWSIDSAHLNHCTGCGLVRRDHPEAHSRAAATDAALEWNHVRPIVEPRLTLGDVLVIGEAVLSVAAEHNGRRSIRAIDIGSLATLGPRESYATVVLLSALATVR